MSVGSLESLKTEVRWDKIGGVELLLGLNTQACVPPPHHHPLHLPHHPAPHLPPPLGRQRGRSGGWQTSPGGYFPLRCSDFLVSCLDSSCFLEVIGSRLFALVMFWDSRGFQGRHLRGFQMRGRGGSHSFAQSLHWKTERPVSVISNFCVCVIKHP